MYTQLDCTKEQKHSSAFGSPLSIPSAAELWLILVSSPASPLSALLSHLPLSSHNIYISLSHTQAKTWHCHSNVRVPQTHMHTRETCYLATQGWDRWRPIRDASERAHEWWEQTYWWKRVCTYQPQGMRLQTFLDLPITIWPNSTVSPIQTIVLYTQGNINK